MKTLEFLIPSYKRPKTLPSTIDSVAKQIFENNLEDRVCITVVDDCSPDLDVALIADKFSACKTFLSFRVNKINKGMSSNIRDMVASSRAFYCSILTDDDQLQSGALAKIIQLIDSMNDQHGSDLLAAFYVPRYSYLEDGTLHGIVCESFNETTVIEPGPLNSLRYMHDGFVLTGLFFKPALINFPLWDRHIENGFFPVIYFSDLLLKYRNLFVHDNWFIHMVLNECHWESWGATDKARYIRLYRDYMEAVSIASKEAFSRTLFGFDMLHLFREETDRYKQQILSVVSKVGNNLTVNMATRRRAAYWMARLELSEFHHVIRAAFERTERVITNIGKFVPPK